MDSVGFATELREVADDVVHVRSDQCARAAGRGALLGVGGPRPFVVARQAATGPAAEGLGFVPRQVHSRFVVGRRPAEGTVPDPARLADPAGVVHLAAASAFSLGLHAGDLHEAAELAYGGLGSGDRPPPAAASPCPGRTRLGLAAVARLAVDPPQRPTARASARRAHPEPSDEAAGDTGA